MEYDNVSFEGNTWVDKKPHLVPFPLGTLQIRLVYPPSILSTQTYSSTYWDQLPCVTQDTTDPVFIQFFVKCVNSEFTTPEQKSIWALKLEDRTTLSVTLKVSIPFLFRAKSARNLTPATLCACSSRTQQVRRTGSATNTKRGKSWLCDVFGTACGSHDVYLNLMTWECLYPSRSFWLPFTVHLVLTSSAEIFWLFIHIFIGSVKMCCCSKYCLQVASVLLSSSDGRSHFLKLAERQTSVLKQNRLVVFEKKNN